MININWAKLYAQGRCKDMGIPWSPEEDKALALGIPVEYVRDDVLTLDEYAKALEKEAKEGKELTRLSREELVQKAVELNVKFSPDATDKVLAEQIEKAFDRKTKAAEQAKAVSKTYEKLEKENVEAIAAQQKAVAEAREPLDELKDTVGGVVAQVPNVEAIAKSVKPKKDKK